MSRTHQTIYSIDEKKTWQWVREGHMFDRVELITSEGRCIPARKGFRYRVSYLDDGKTLRFVAEKLRVAVKPGDWNDASDVQPTVGVVVAVRWANVGPVTGLMKYTDDGKWLVQSGARFVPVSAAYAGPPVQWRYLPEAWGPQ